MDIKISKKSVEETDLEYILDKAKVEFEILAGKNLFFTGAGGFLGYYFIKSVLSWNNGYPKKAIHITGLDNFTDSTLLLLTKGNQKKITDFKLIKHDVTNFEISQDEAFDYIIHAASIASPKFYRRYPIETINANVQ